MSISRRHLGLALTAATGIFAASGCQSDANSAQGVAERFVDQHYVQMNLAAAEPYCAGLALEKVRESMRLTQGFKIDASTKKPVVRYRVTPHGESGDEATFLFDATIQVDNDEPFERRWLVLTKKVDGQWKVANYSEQSAE